MAKISIITAIHNGLPFNKIYADYLKKYTFNPYELIIIDNVSTDGSAEFFEEQGAVVIKNKENYSYPRSQNQGIDAARTDYLFFLNNDIIVSPQWDKRLIDAAELHGLDIISAKGIENMGNKKESVSFDHKWKRIKNPLMMLGGGERNLRNMHKLMYGNWEKFCEDQFEKYGLEVAEGILGNNVMIRKAALQKIGLWDESQQAADFDLFMRTKKRAMQHHDIKPCQIALGVYIHHYIRMTLKYSTKPKPFADKDSLIPLSAKWTKEELDFLHPDNQTIRKI